MQAPSLRLMSLSATGRANGTDEPPFSLDRSDHEHKIVSQRLNACKLLKLVSLDDGNDALAKTLANQAWEVAQNGKANIRCLIYADKREVAEKAKGELEKLAKPKGNAKQACASIGLLVGARRVREREQVREWLAEHGFLAGASTELARPAFLIATSAGEVGIDLDADHMVCDLVPWERMVQRLGRVNRRGEKECAQVIVVHGKEPTARKAANPTEAEKREICAFRSLDVMARLCSNDDGHNASPAALLCLKQRAAGDENLRQQIEAATSPAPLHPELTSALADAWAMTSLDEHPGRPDIQPWLRGWIDEEPQTAVIWRRHLPVRADMAGRSLGKAEEADIEAFFEAARPQLSEMLETESDRVAAWLKARAKALLKAGNGRGAINEGPDAEDTEPGAEDAESQQKTRQTQDVGTPLRTDDIVALLLRQDGRLEHKFKLEDIAKLEKKRLANRLLIVDARLGGLKDGLLDSKSSDLPLTADGDESWSQRVGFRVRRVGSDDDATDGEADADDGWRFAFACVVRRDAEGVPLEQLVVEQAIDAEKVEDARAITRPQTLAEHQSWTEAKAREIAGRLDLPQDATEALAVAALLHDEGKRAERWQRAFKAHRDAAATGLALPLAKTRGPIDQARLAGYRHEFGSLPHAIEHERFKALAPGWQDLVLHLIAAHHGQARPVISTDGCEDAPPSALQKRAGDVALRFARLQRRWGPWGLAWWEALLRAADQQASRENDQGVPSNPAECEGTV